MTRPPDSFDNWEARLQAPPVRPPDSFDDWEARLQAPPVSDAVVEFGPDRDSIVLGVVREAWEDQVYGDRDDWVAVLTERGLEAWPPTGDLYADDALPSLVDYRNRLLALRSALGDVLSDVEARIAQVVGEGGKFVAGPDFFQVRKGTTFRIRPDAVSEFWAVVEEAVEKAFLTEDPAEVEKYRTAVRSLFSPNQVRKGGLRALTEAGILVRNIDRETGEVRVGPVWDLFETVEDEAPSLQTMPVFGKATPKFVASLPEFEVRYGRGAGSTTRPGEETKG